VRDQPEVVAAFERHFEQQTVAAYVRCCRMLLDANAGAIVGTVGVPCLAITGEDDHYAPPGAVAEFLDHLPHPARLEVIAGCGHLPFLEQPAAFAAAVKAFLRTC
jgi:3-oxoadipate enol-lactonase